MGGGFSLSANGAKQRSRLPTPFLVLTKDQPISPRDIPPMFFRDVEGPHTYTSSTNGWSLLIGALTPPATETRMKQIHPYETRTDEFCDNGPHVYPLRHSDDEGVRYWTTHPLLGVAEELVCRLQNSLLTGDE